MPRPKIGKKRETVWLGDNVHLMETCDPQTSSEQETTRPHLIVDVHTIVAPLSDWEMTAAIQKQLAQGDLKLAEHLDAGSVTADHLVGPVMPDTTRQAQKGLGFVPSRFPIDWQARHVTCPQGQICRREVHRLSGLGELHAVTEMRVYLASAPAIGSHYTARAATRAREGTVSPAVYDPLRH